VIPGPFNDVAGGLISHFRNNAWLEAGKKRNPRRSGVVKFAAPVRCLLTTPPVIVEAIARMERELSRLHEAISSIQDSYGQDHLYLTVVKGYLRKLITNDRVARYLEEYQPELFIEFQKIA
jgi:hypothetical protein